jgi:hypothetical protein
MQPGYVPSATDEARMAPELPSYRGGGVVCHHCGREMSVHMASATDTGNGPGSATYQEMGPTRVAEALVHPDVKGPIMEGQPSRTGYKI